jgi:hypothetical protein
MAIDFNTFLAWAEERFGDDVIINGKEIRINSIFKVNDQEHKLYCNTEGGINDVDLGVYHCWKSGRYGTLAGLVMLVDNCSFEDALDTLNGRISFATLYQRVEDFFNQKEVIQNQEVIIPELVLPESSYSILDLSRGNPFRQRAELYLMKRKIPIEGMYVCTSGLYWNRIVIPYYNRDGKLIYFNCRTLSDKIPKYRGPEKEVGTGKGDVLYVPKWPEEPTEIYLTEGEFDTISIWLSGFYAAALGGKIISDQQMNLLYGLIPIMAFDSDKAGRSAIVEIGDKFLNSGRLCYYVCPPVGFKDWNALLEEYGFEVLKQYLIKHKKRYTEYTKIEFLVEGGVIE